MNKTYIVAEVGPNHNGSFQLALEFVEKLSLIGVDAIKFQLAVPELLYSKDSFKATYQKKGDNEESALEMSLRNQLTRNEHISLYNKCREAGTDYLCTAFDIQSLKFLNENMDLPYFKIASGEIFSLDIIEYISKCNKPIILSSGMASYSEIETCINIINKISNKEITVLHCISNYPTPYEDVNMNVMLELKKRFGYSVGFSDHTLGNKSSLTAVAMGASIIEKHVTLDKTLPGPDHQASSTIEEFDELVKSIRRVEKIKGTRVKKLSLQEKEIASMARKSIVSKRDILPGEIIKEEDICYKRPGTGFLPTEKQLVVGKKVATKIEADRVIQRKYLS
jgi:N,N'-diacetyllegionaminate synthase